MSEQGTRGGEPRSGEWASPRGLVLTNGLGVFVAVSGSLLHCLHCAGAAPLSRVKMAYNEQAGQWVAIKVLNRTDIKLNELSWQVKREVRWEWKPRPLCVCSKCCFASRHGGPL